MKTSAQAFDPDKVAHFEKAGWEAYYARQWCKAFGLMVQLNREQFRMRVLIALAAAVDIVRASMAFAPLENNDVPAAREHIRRYYDKARRSVGIAADAQTLADLEMDYWVVHRRLALERKVDHTLDNAGPMVDSFERLHAALFKAPAAALRRSAQQRALAAVAVDRITGGYSKDIAADWREAEKHLQEAYRAVK